jgi:hypothetical protein
MQSLPPIRSASQQRAIEFNRDGGPREWFKTLLKGKKAQQIVAAPPVR